MFSVSSLAPHAHKLKFLLNQNSTAILTGVGVAGTAGTAILTGRASFKAAALIEQEQRTRVRQPIGKIKTVEADEKGVRVEGELFDVIHYPLSKTEKVKLVWPQYLPAAACGVTTVAAIIVAHRIDAKKIAALAMAAGVSERALQEYKDKVLDKFTDRQAQAVKDDIAQDKVTAFPPSGQVHIFGNGDVLCFDEYTGRYFNGTVEKIRGAMNHVNSEIIKYDYASLSRFYNELDLPPTTLSDRVGWNVDYMSDVNLSTVMSSDNRPCISIGFTRDPSFEFDTRQRG